LNISDEAAYVHYVHFDHLSFTAELTNAPVVM